MGTKSRYIFIGHFWTVTMLCLNRRLSDCVNNFSRTESLEIMQKNKFVNLSNFPLTQKPSPNFMDN